MDLCAPFICLQEAVKSMKTRGGGSIVNIGYRERLRRRAQARSLLGVEKRELMTLTRNAASALNRYHIRVNQLNVGWTLTEGEDAVQKKQGFTHNWLADAVKVMPFGRLLTPREIACAAAYFASTKTRSSPAACSTWNKCRSGRRGTGRETGDRRQETGDRRQETGDRRQEAGDRRQETGDRRQETGGRRREIGGRR